ncbi:HesA/MoeB/ThiF family protein [Rhodobacteraceae bacterium SC52]|nr:HesA/MoeB/ThiF family protein [Rhodobacteraceae bacterium SC52]
MVLFLVLAALIWGLGRLMKTPPQARILLIGILYVLVIGLLVALPQDAPLRQTLGGSAREWLAVGVLGAVGFGYSILLRRLKTRVRPENQTTQTRDAPDPEAPLNDAELDRYARHIILRELGGPGQRALKRSKVLVIGAGGLGAPVLQYLAGAGFGTIGVIDDDVVSASNLQRQVIHRDADIGRPKVFSAREAMMALNPNIFVRPYNRRLTEEIAADLMAEYDLVLDGSDNFETRYLVNAACVGAGVPLVSGAIAQWEGQISVYDPANGAPCFACVFPKPPAPGLAPSCAEAGVIGPLPGIVGSMMAAEALKIIVGAGTSLRGTLLIHDALEGESRRIAVARRPECAVCGKAS